MMLLTKANRKALPALYAQENKGEDAIAYVKYFLPGTGWTWYATEFDGTDRFFGLTVGQFTELGYFSLKELASVRSPGWRLKVERDYSFYPTPLKDCRKKHSGW